MFWGISPAIDFLELGIGRNLEEVNILLLGQVDLRHIIKTMARSYRHPHRRINFYIVEGMLECVARQIMLCTIIYEPLEHVGLLNKTLMFMEIYGNLLVRPSTSQYLATKAHHLTNIITNPTLIRECIPMIDINLLKYKQRDYIETIFKFWSKCSNKDFNACHFWNMRVRRLLGVRYDSRNGAFDWDYYMRIKSDTEIDRICIQEYKHFRETGIAFTRLDCEFSDANLSLAAGIVEDGDEMCHNGYLGDISTGPFITYGMDCDDKDMLKITNRANAKRCTDIIERNVMRYFHEIATRTPYVHEEALEENKYNTGAVTFLLSEVSLGKSETVHRKHSPWKPLLPNENIKIHFLSSMTLRDYNNGNALQQFFQGLFIGHQMLKGVTTDLLRMLTIGAQIFIETRAAGYAYSKEEMMAFGEEIREFAKASGFTPCKDFDPIKDTLANFTRT